MLIDAQVVEAEGVPRLPDFLARIGVRDGGERGGRGGVREGGRERGKAREKG